MFGKDILSKKLLHVPQMTFILFVQHFSPLFRVWQTHLLTLAELHELLVIGWLIYTRALTLE